MPQFSGFRALELLRESKLDIPFILISGTIGKGMARHRREGAAGWKDRSSRPASSPRRTPNAQVAVVLALRRLRLPGFQIARQSGLSRATISRILRRHGLAKLSALEAAKPVVRYQRDHPGELLHFDIKKLGRINGKAERFILPMSNLLSLHT
jgi:CheY-like chemotaxis protein